MPFEAAEPDVDRGYLDGGFVAHGQLVEAGGYGAVLFEQVDAALHGVALLVRLLVEGGRPATARAELAPVGRLVLLDWDDAADPATAQVGPVTVRAVRLVTQHPTGSGAWPAAVQARDPDALQHGDELWAIAALPSRNQDRQRLTALLTAQVQLGGPPAPRAAQRVVGRLDPGSPAGWFLLQIPFFRAP